jgi:Flp pilus assembly protein TadG
MTPERRAPERRSAGTSIVEMSLVLPLLLLLIFGIGEFSIAFTQWETITNAAREGAREGVVFRGGACDAGTVDNEVAQAVDTYITSSGLTTGSVTAAVTGACAGSGTPLRVSVSAPYRFQMLPGLAGLTPVITLGATSVMRNE